MHVILVTTTYLYLVKVLYILILTIFSGILRGSFFGENAFGLWHFLNVNHQREILAGLGDEGLDDVVPFEDELVILALDHRVRLLQIYLRHYVLEYFEALFLLLFLL